MSWDLYCDFPRYGHFTRDIELVNLGCKLINKAKKEIVIKDTVFALCANSDYREAFRESLKNVMEKRNPDTYILGFQKGVNEKATEVLDELKDYPNVRVSLLPPSKIDNSENDALVVDKKHWLVTDNHPPRALDHTGIYGKGDKFVGEKLSNKIIGKVTGQPKIYSYDDDFRS